MVIFIMTSFSCTTLQGHRQIVNMLSCRSRLPPAYPHSATCTSAKTDDAMLHSSSVQCDDASLASCSHTPTLSPLVLFGLVEAARWTILPHAAQASVAQGVIAAVRDSIPDPLIVLLLAAMPLVELRGAIPVGCDSHCSFSWLQQAQSAAAWTGPLCTQCPPWTGPRVTAANAKFCTLQCTRSHCFQPGCLSSWAACSQPGALE